MSEIQKPLNYPVITGRPESARKGAQGKPVPQAAGGTSFGELLHQTMERAQTRELTFSKHAQARTAKRGIELTETDISKLSDAVGKAGERGVTDTLVFMNNTAFIVNVPSRVVVTVVDGGDTGSVFTNINGAVIVQGE